MLEAWEFVWVNDHNSVGNKWFELAALIANPIPHIFWVSPEGDCVHGAGFVLLLKLLENILEYILQIYGHLKTPWMWKTYIGNNKREKNIESYVVQERCGKKICHHYCKQTLREAFFFFAGFLVPKTPKSTGNTHDSSCHEEHVSCLSITAITGC